MRVPNGSSLQSNNNLTNSGTIIVENGGALTGEVNGKVIYAPSITTESLPEGKVNEKYSASLTATGSDPINWGVTGSLPEGLTLSEKGTITGTPTASGDYLFTVTASNDAGSVSKELTIKVKHVHSYGEPTWEWANDNTAKAIFKCEKGDDTQSLSGIMSSKITKDATCDAKGIRTYTAKVTFGGKEYTATKDIEIPALSCNTSQGNDQPYDDGGPFTRNECGDVFDRWGNLIYDAPDCVVKPKPTTSPQTTLKPENTTETTLDPVETEEPEQSVEPEKTTTPKPTTQASSTPDSDVKVEKENSFGFIWWILGGIGVVIVGIVAYLVIKNNTEDDE